MIPVFWGNRCIMPLMLSFSQSVSSCVAESLHRTSASRCTAPKFPACSRQTYTPEATSRP